MKYRDAQKAPHLWLVKTDTKQEFLLDREPGYDPHPMVNIVAWRNVGGEWSPGDAFQRFFDYIHRRAD